MNELLHDAHSTEHINEIRRKVYGDDFVKPCDLTKVNSEMDLIIDNFEKECGIYHENN